MKPMLIIFLLVFLQGCKDHGMSPRQPESAIQLSALDIGTMDVTLKISLNTTIQPRQVVFKRDNDTVWVLHPTGRDTIVVDPPGVPELWPATRYTYKAYLLNGQTAVDSSVLAVTTGDSSSHAIQWTIDTIGTAHSYLKDVAIISDSSIWAVGELFLNDSNGQLDPRRYNLARWDGTSWRIDRLMYQGSPPVLHSIFAFSEDDIWLDPWFHWNGQTFQQVPIDPIFIGVGVNKMWGSADGRLYVVGNGGFIAARSLSGTWRRIESGTNVPLTDIWGTPDGSEVWACGFNDSNGGSVVLRHVNGTWQILWDRLAPPRPPYIYSAYLSSLWSSGRGEFVATGGRFYHHSLHNLNIVRNEYVRVGNTYPIFQQVNWAYRVRGTQRNDVWLVGDDAMICHWNGSTWHRYEELLDSDVIFYSLAVTERYVVAVGDRSNGIYSTGIVIRGRR